MMVPNHYSDNDYNKAQSMKKNILLVAKYEYKGEERKERKKERKKKKNKTCSDPQAYKASAPIFTPSVNIFIRMNRITD
jgi:hypothetical protein